MSRLSRLTKTFMFELDSVGWLSWVLLFAVGVDWCLTLWRLVFYSASTPDLWSQWVISSCRFNPARISWWWRWRRWWCCFCFMSSWEWSTLRHSIGFKYNKKIPEPHTYVLSLLFLLCRTLQYWINRFFWTLASLRCSNKMHDVKNTFYYFLIMLFTGVHKCTFRCHIIDANLCHNVIFENSKTSTLNLCVCVCACMCLYSTCDNLQIIYFSTIVGTFPE